MGALLAQYKSLIVAFLSSLLFVLGYTSAMPAAANCDANYIIHCGVTSAGDVANHYGDSGVAAVYSYFGISSSDINTMGGGAVLGDVYSNGDVKIQTQVNGQTHYPLVATNAMTAGWQNITGSTTIHSNGFTFYVRPTSVSFQSSPLTAYVMMDSNGQFRFAVLKDCGNPVKATPVPKPAPAPKPAPKPMPTPQPTPQPAPTPQAQAQTQSQNQSQTQSQTQSQNVTVNQPAQMPNNTTNNNYYTQPQQQAQTSAQTYTTPAPAPAPTYTAPVSTALPNTGPGNIAGMAIVFGSLAGLGHYLFFGRGGSKFLSGVKYF